MITGFPNSTQPLIEKTSGQLVEPWYSLLVGFFQRREERAGITVLKVGPRAMGWSNATPTAGAWRAGDVLFDPSPTVGQPYLRVCTVSGSPGTWVTGANL